MLILIYSKEIAMIINRNSELEKNMYAKLSQVDELISSNDVYALGLRLNALSSLFKELREDSAVKALTEALDKVIESGIIDSIDKNSLKHFMIGNAFYTASDFIGDDKYKSEAVKLASGFKDFERNEAGYFKDADDKKCLCKAYSYEPFYMAYETKDGGKEQYNDVIGQYNAMNDELFADTKYASDTTAKVKVLSVYAASLIDTMEVMDQMIYEIYRKMQDYFKASVKAVLETGRDYDNFDDFDEESELMFAYAVSSDFIGDDKYKSEAVKLASGFKDFERNEAGYFKDADDKKCLCKAYSYEPFYMAYETKDGGKEQYNDVIGQYNAMNDELFADTKYASDTTAKVKVLSVYAASLIDTMEVMDQMIYEIYRKMQDYFKASVKAVLETGRDYDNFDDFDEESELMFAYAVLKGCRMKALHTEKYEGIVLGVCDKVMAGEIFTDDDTDKNVVSKAALVYSETVRNREYQDYGRGKGGALWS